MELAGNGYGGGCRQLADFAVDRGTPVRPGQAGPRPVTDADDRTVAGPNRCATRDMGDTCLRFGHSACPQGLESLGLGVENSQVKVDEGDEPLILLDFA